MKIKILRIKNNKINEINTAQFSNLNINKQNTNDKNLSSEQKKLLKKLLN